ncbi:MAG: PfkB family carbohydrate kinase [Spirochaetales bacterium]
MNPTLQKTFWFPKVELAQVNRVSRQREDASGKGINVTRVLTQLGEPAVHVTQVGGAGADLFLELARGDKLDVRPVHAEIEIRNCYTLLDAGAGTTTELVEAGDHVPDGVEDEVRRSSTFSVARDPWCFPVRRRPGSRVSSIPGSLSALWRRGCSCW